MQIGCGLRVMRVKGLSYLYIWHYEDLDGQRKQVYEYIGPAEDPNSGRRAADRMEVYVRKAMSDARKQLESGKTQAIAAARRSRRVILK